MGRLTLRPLLSCPLSLCCSCWQQVGDCLGWTAACTARGRTTRRGGRGWEESARSGSPKTSHRPKPPTFPTHGSHLPPVESGAGGVGHRTDRTGEWCWGESLASSRREDTFQLAHRTFAPQPKQPDLARCLLSTAAEKIQLTLVEILVINRQKYNRYPGKNIINQNNN